MENNTKFLQNYDHNFYNGKPLKFEVYICKDCTQKNKEYVKENIENKDLKNNIHNLIEKYSFPTSWHKSAWYDLKYNPVLDELSERVIIEWGKSTLTWVQRKDKKILEIKYQRK